MDRIKLKLIIILLQIILASAAGAANKIMPLGDSITRGETSGVPDEEFQVSYRKALYDKLEAAGYVINDEIFVGTLFSGESEPDFDPDHDGRSGWQADEIVDGKSGFPVDDKLDQWLIVEEPNIVLLHIGTNDISNNNEDWTEVDDILDTIDDYETTSGNGVWVVLALIVDRSCSLDNPPCQNSLDTTTFNSNVETLVFGPRQAGGDNILLVDMQDGAGIDYRRSTLGGDMWDDIHPFETGYAKMADLWWSALQQILPVADAGPDQRVAEFETVTLDGSGSTDPKIGHGNNLSYQWVQTTGTPVVLSDDTAVQPTFDAPDAGPAGKTLTFTLTVTDEDELVATDEVDVDVAIIQANAGPDQTVNESVTVTLDASNSIGVGLEYQWMQTAGTPVMLSDDTAVQPTFTAPNVGSNGETLSFRLTITDDDGLEDTDTVKITVRNPNSSGGGGGGGGGGGCFIATATICSPMTLSGKAPHEPYNQTTMVIWQRLMAGNRTLLTPSAGHTATQALGVSMVMLLSFGVAINLRKPWKRWRKH